jgi:hypothetical protein|tara:strand:+ start:59 stop:256 length:198 start_codon:yes stop_codon:yes gene_type:complete
MDNDRKIEIIKQLLMIETTEWLEKVKKVVIDGICAESDQDTIDQEEYKKWKESRKKGDNDDEIPF